MKKFLTVLLALSVVFTYTVGTAFATALTPSDVATKANAKVETEMANINAAKTLYLNNVTFTKTTVEGDLDEGVEFAFIDNEAGQKVKLSKDALDAVIAAVIADAQNDVSKAQIEVINANVTDADSLAKELVKITNAAKAYYDDFAGKIAAKADAKYELTLAKARYLAAVNAVDPANYSTTALTEDVIAEGLVKADGSRQAKVVALKEKALADLGKELTASQAKKVAADFLAVVANIKTIAQEGTDAANLAVAKENAIKNLTNNADNAYRGQKKQLEDAIAAETDATTKAELQKKLDALQGNIDAIVAMRTVKINAAKTPTDVAKIKVVDSNATTVNTTEDTIFGLAAQALINSKDEIAQALKDQAELDKITTIDGITLKYQDGAVDEALANALVKVYGNEYKTVAEALAGYKAELATKTNDALVATKKAAIKEIKDTDLTAYDETRVAEAQALIDEYVAKVEAATTSKAVADAKDAFDTALKKVISIAQHKKDIAANGVLGREYTAKYVAVLDAYVDYYYASNNLDKDKTTPSATTVKTAVKDYVLEGYTKEEMAARIDGAKAIVDNLKVGDALVAAANSVKAAIDAIDKNITLASKAGILAADDAMKDYLKNPGTVATDVPNYAMLNAAKTTLQALEKANVKTLADAIATAADKVAAVNAAKEAYDAYVADYPADKAAVADAKAKIDAAQAKIDADAAKAVSEMIAVLTDANKVTVDDKAAIEAARAAYDALTDEAKALVSAVNKSKLDLCEKALAIASIKAVETLKITASSVAKKGSITVKWVVKGDASAAEAFEIWKSTKKSSKFSKSFTTTDGTKRTYKNTKALKKGTRYYYKVRAIAYDANGNKVTSDWSNKAYRIAK